MIGLKIDAKLEGKLTCAFKNDTRNFPNFHRLKNSDFILESKMVYLNQNKNSKQPDQPDVVWKLYFGLEKMNSTVNKNFYTCSTKSLFLRYAKISKKAVKLGSFSMLSTYISKTQWRLLKNQFKNFVKPYHDKLSSKAWSM